MIPVGIIVLFLGYSSAYIGSWKIQGTDETVLQLFRGTSIVKGSTSSGGGGIGGTVSTIVQDVTGVVQFLTP